MATLEPGSKSVSSTGWEPALDQRPITQPELAAEKRATSQPEWKTQQVSSAQQELASQPRPVTQQKPFTQEEVESQEEPRTQPKSVLHQKCLASKQSPPTQRVHFSQQETDLLQGPEAEKMSTTQEEPELRQGDGAQAGPGPTELFLAQKAELAPIAQGIPGPGKGPPAQIESPSQKRPEQSASKSQQPPPVQEAKCKGGSLTEREFLTRLRELSIQPSAQEWKEFFEWITDPESESDVRTSSEKDPPAMRGGSVALGETLACKRKPSYETMQGCGGRSSYEKTSAQDHRRYQDTGESEPGGNGAS